MDLHQAEKHIKGSEYHQTSSSDNGTDDTSLAEADANIWDKDESNRTAHYNYASEKSLSHADAKLFFQRHKLESIKRDAESEASLARSNTVPSSLSDRAGRPRRATSIASHANNYDDPSREKYMEPFTAGERSNTEELKGDHDVTFFSYDYLNGHKMNLGHEQSKDNLIYPGVLAENQKIVGSDISPEMREICNSIKKVLEIRHRLIEISLQRPNDNPKDEAGWRIHPPPPEPVWDEVKNQPRSQNYSLSHDKDLPAGQNPKKHRKPGQDIGEDFDISDFLPLPEEAEDMYFELDSGSVYQVFRNARSTAMSSSLLHVPTLRDFYKDLEYVKNVSSDGPCKSFAFRELEILEGKFNLHFLMNEYEETATCKRVPHRDFYNVRKVDTHVHHSACMNQKHLLRFIKSKMKKSPNETVLFRDGKYLTLDEVFKSINLTAYDLSIDTLDMHVCHQFFRMALL